MDKWIHASATLDDHDHLLADNYSHTLDCVTFFIWRTICVLTKPDNLFILHIIGCDVDCACVSCFSAHFKYLLRKRRRPYITTNDNNNNTNDSHSMGWHKILWSAGRRQQQQQQRADWHFYFFLYPNNVCPISGARRENWWRCKFEWKRFKMNRRTDFKWMRWDFHYARPWPDEFT